VSLEPDGSTVIFYYNRLDVVFVLTVKGYITIYAVVSYIVRIASLVFASLLSGVYKKRIRTVAKPSKIPLYYRACPKDADTTKALDLIFSYIYFTMASVPIGLTPR